MEQVSQTAIPQTESREALSMKSLLEAGVHFGHQTRRWDPKMNTYIFTQRNGIHIIDLQQTLTLVERAAQSIQDLVASGGTILFVGTKKQANETMESEALRCGMFFINQRWLGGTLTNWETIKSRINHLSNLEEREEKGEFNRLPKKEVLRLQEQIARLRKYLRGIQHMKSLPTAIFIIDLSKEKIAVAEAIKMRIPTFALVDTDCNPKLVNNPIPGNDDAIRSIKLITGRIADAVIAGKKIRELQEIESLSSGEDDDQTIITSEQALATEEAPSAILSVDDHVEEVTSSEQNQSLVDEAVPETKDTRSPEEIALDELPLEDLQVDDEDDPEFSPYV